MLTETSSNLSSLVNEFTFVAVDGGHEEELERRVVEQGHAAVNEDELLVAAGDGLRPGSRSAPPCSARTSFHKGMSRLQSYRFASLYFAFGLFDTGQGESVDAFAMTTISSVLSDLDCFAGSSGDRSVVFDAELFLQQLG